MTDYEAITGAGCVGEKLIVGALYSGKSTKMADMTTLSEFFAAERKKIKQKMSVTTDQTETRELDNRQLAFKVASNEYFGLDIEDSNYEYRVFLDDLVQHTPKEKGLLIVNLIESFLKQDLRLRGIANEFIKHADTSLYTGLAFLNGRGIISNIKTALLELVFTRAGALRSYNGAVELHKPYFSLGNTVDSISTSATVIHNKTPSESLQESLKYKLEKAEDKEDITENTECKVCMEKASKCFCFHFTEPAHCIYLENTLLPCMHVCICMQCAVVLTKCPVCRADYRKEDVKEVFIA